MSELLFRWINEDIPLDETITNFEENFSDGYLLGKILHLFNQQTNFDSFTPNNSANAKINNWCLLQPVINSLNIKFNSKDAYDIMCEKKGCIIRLLYQIKVSPPRPLPPTLPRQLT